jgi:chitinase
LKLFVLFFLGFKELINLKKKNPYLKVQISIGGDIKSFSDIGLDGTRRKQFSGSVTGFLTEHGFDGVDLDWSNTDHPVGHAPHK